LLPTDQGVGKLISSCVGYFLGPKFPKVYMRIHIFLPCTNGVDGGFEVLNFNSGYATGWLGHSLLSDFYYNFSLIGCSYF
jgi:hypothetical protein